MKKIFIIIGVVLLFSSIRFVYLNYKDNRIKPIKPEIIVKTVKPDLPPEPELKPRISNNYVKPEHVPDSLKDFYDLKKSDRLELVTKMMNNKHLHGETLEFFKAEIFNRKWVDTTRNNMANALCWQTKQNPELHKLFILMAGDDNENEVWRDYSIQFLSECYDSSNDKAIIIDTFKKYSTGDDSKAGTALLHLSLQEGFNNIKLDDAYSNLLDKQLANPNVSIHTKTTILAIIGKRGDKSKLELVRKYAKQDDDAALKAVAIGSLGLIGDVTDMSIIQPALHHKNGRISLAALGAINRINARNRAKVKAIRAIKAK